MIFLSTHVELTNVRAFKRVCYTCCDPIDCMDATNQEMVDIPLPNCPRRNK